MADEEFWYKHEDGTHETHSLVAEVACRLWVLGKPCPKPLIRFGPGSGGKGTR